LHTEIAGLKASSAQAQINVKELSSQDAELPSLSMVKQRLDTLDSGNYLHACSWRRITQVVQAMVESDPQKRKTLLGKAQW
jgi:hypothetical protein